MAKGEKKPSKKDEASVLGSLPATRPSRLGRHRAGEEAGAQEPPKAAPKRAPARPKAKTTPKPKPKPAAKPKAATTAATPRASGPRPVRSGASGLDAVPVDERPGKAPPSGAELVSTVVKAAGEVAQIGITVSGQIIKRAVDRLPKP
jgi:hypothetical protein